MYKNELISIIIPVYNTYNYLEKCLNSALNQTYKNIEVIIVDDGSTDKSKNIIDSFMSQDKRITYYYQENSGVGIARNLGISLSKGNYILFIDSDDYVDLTFVEKMYYAIKENDLFSICGTITVYLDGTEKENFVRREFVDTFRGIATYRKLINKKFLLESQIIFPNLKICEDLEFYSKLLIYGNMTYSIVDECLYYYVERKDSLIHTYNKNQDDTLKAVDNILEYCKSNNKFEKYYDQLEYLYIVHVIGGYIKRLILSGISEIELENVYNNITTKFNNWHNNKYIGQNDYLPELYRPYLFYLRNKDFLLVIKYVNEKL